MQGLRYRPLPNGPTPEPTITTKRRQSPLSIDAAEPPEKRIERLITENPVVIFSRRSCCMCHVMKRLFVTVGAHPTVIELEEAEEEAAAAGAGVGLPSVFIGGSPVGGLEGLMALHLGGVLVPRLKEVGALWG